MNRNKKEFFRVSVCAICLIFIGVVVGLVVKNQWYGQKNGADIEEADSENGTDGDMTDGSADNGNTDETTDSGAAQALIVMGDVEYKDAADGGNSDSENAGDGTGSDGGTLSGGTGADSSDGEIDMSTYNGEELADNGCGYAIKVNRQENIVTVYSLDADGYYTVPVKAMRCSVSPAGATETGLFRISGKWNWLKLYNNCYGQYVSQIVGDTLFHSVPYLSTSKDSLETWEFNKLGTSASLGCVRLCVADTKWIYENCETGTYVNIFDSDYYGPLGRPVTVTTLENTDEAGWDPTDMDEANPYAGQAALYGVESHSIQLGENYDAMAGVWAFSSDREDVTADVTVTGSVDNTKPGDYTVIYSFMDGGEEITKSIVITVEDSEAPVITRLPVSLTVLGHEGQTQELAELVASYITASDNGDKIDTAYAVDAGGKTESGAKATELGETAICVNMSSITAADGAGSVRTGEYTVICYAVDASGNKSACYVVKLILSE